MILLELQKVFVVGQLLNIHQVVNRAFRWKNLSIIKQETLYLTLFFVDLDALRFGEI